jgi:hypothetical protein
MKSKALILAGMFLLSSVSMMMNFEGNDPFTSDGTFVQIDEGDLNPAEQSKIQTNGEPLGFGKEPIPEFNSPWLLELIVNEGTLEVHVGPNQAGAPTGSGMLSWQYLAEGWSQITGTSEVTLTGESNVHLADVPNLPEGYGQLRLTLSQGRIASEAVFQLTITPDAITIDDPNESPASALIEKPPVTDDLNQPGIGELWDIPEIISSAEADSGGTRARQSAQVHNYSADSLPSSPWTRGYFNGSAGVGWGTSSYSYTQGTAAIWSAGYDFNSTSNRTCNSSSCTYANNMHTIAYAPISLSSYSNVSTLTLSYDILYDLENGYDYFYVMASGDGGTTWSELVNYTGNGSGWSNKTLNITSYKGNANFVLYFRMTSDSTITNSGVFVDDVEITYITPNQPDLVSDWISGPTSGTAGTAYSVTRSFQNSGSGNSSSFTYGIYLSTNNVISTGDTLAYSYTFSNGMVSGSSSNASISVTIPSSLSAGTYYWGLIVDINNTVSESSETNNARASSSTISVTNSATVTVSVTLEFYDYYQANNSGCSSSNNYCYSAAEYIAYQLWDVDNTSSNDLLASGYLDSSGNVTISGLNNRETLQGNQDIYFVFYALTTAAQVVTYSSQNVYTWSTNVVWNVPDGSYSFGTIYPSSNQGALYTAIAMRDSRSLANSVGSSTISMIDVRWPTSSGAFFQPSGPYIALNDGFGATVIFHEYGHYVDEHFSSHTGGGGSHAFNACTSDDLGWSEGWASFFAIVTKSQYNYFNPTWYKSWHEYESGRPYDANGWASINNPSNGTHWQCLEEVVTGILWDMYDGSDDDVDSDHFGDEFGAYDSQYFSEIWNLSLNYNPSHDFTLADFTAYLRSTASSFEDEYFDILVEHGVRPAFSCNSSSYGDAGLSGDAGDTLSTRSTISSGHYNGCMNSSSDTDDYFQVYVPSGNALEVTIVSPAVADYDLYLLATNGSSLSFSSGTLGMEWSNTSTNSQYIVIRVTDFSGSGVYGLDIKIVNQSNTQADLVATSISGPVIGPPGGAASITYRIDNTGGASAAGFSFQIRLSTNSLITSSDPLVATYSYSGLAAGSYYYFTLNVTIPSTLANGTTYYWGLMVDTGGNVTESNENNNAVASSTTITITKPDLIAYSISGSSSGTPGGTAQVTYWINNGGSDADAFSFQIRLSTNNVISTTDVLVATYGYNNLSAGGSAYWTLNVTIPSTLSTGTTYYWGLMVDTTSAVDEYNENNNAIASSNTISIVSLPNLEAIWVSGPSQINPGGTALVSRSFTNSGGSSAGSFTYGLYLSSNTIISTGDTLVYSFTMNSGLNSSWSSNGSISVTIPASLTSGNTYYWGLLVDISNTVLESDENDNDKGGGSTEVGCPTSQNDGNSGSDAPSNRTGALSVGSNPTTTSYYSGCLDFSDLADYWVFSMTAGYDVDIQLTSPSGADFDLYLQDSNGSTLDSSFNSGTIDSVSTSSTGASGSAGTYFIRVEEFDSSGYYQLRIWANQTYYPDLVANWVSGPVTVNPGQTTTVSRTYGNSGNLNSGGFTFGIYLSINNYISTNDTLVSSSYHGGLSAGTYGNYSGTVTIPTTMAPGVYYWGLVMDISDSVSESNEGNNQIAGGTVLVGVCLFPPDDMGQGLDAPSPGFGSPVNLGPGAGIGCLDQIDDLDVYSFSVAAHTRTTITLQPPSGSDFNLELQDSGGTILSISSNSGSLADTVTDTTSQFKSYIIVVSRFNGTGGDYDLTISVESLPDLVLNSITVNSPVTSGTPLIAQIAIENQGSAATSQFDIELYLSEDSILDAGDSGLLTQQHSVLGSGSQANVNLNVNLNLNTTGGGYYACVLLDSSSVLQESTSTNNWICTILLIEEPVPGMPVSVNQPPRWTNLTSITLQWQAPSGGIAAVTHYLYLVDGIQMGSVTGTYLDLPLEEGDHSIEIRAVNEVGNQGEPLVFQVGVDRTAPTAPDVQNPLAWYGKMDSQVLSIGPCTDSLSGLARKEYSLSGDWAVIENNALELQLAEGNHQLTVRCVDVAGNLGPVTSRVIQVDLTAPDSPLIIGPSGWVGPIELTFRLSTGSDQLSGVSHTEYSIDSGSWVVWSGSEITLTYYTGEHTFAARTIDMAGNPSEIQNLSILIDSDAPIFTLDAVEPFYLAGEVIRITLPEVVDSQSGFSHYSWKFDSGTWANLTILDMNLDALSDGEYRLSIQAHDQVGNPSDIQYILINVDGTSPGMPSVECPSDWINRVDIFCTVAAGTDDRSGISHLEYTIEGGDWQAATLDQDVVYLNLADGVTTISFRWLDNAGHTSEAVSADIRIDTVVPVITVIQTGVMDEYQNDLSRSQLRAEVLVNTSDTGSGVFETHYSVDGGSSWLNYPANGRVSPPSIDSRSGVECQFRVRDQAGNEAIQIITLDFTPGPKDQSASEGGILAVGPILIFSVGGLILILFTFVMVRLKNSKGGQRKSD